MYPDSRDAIREYIQNGVDAKAKIVDVTILQDSIAVEDDGLGMDHETLKNAIRIGVSDKNPGHDVGFMGIGIYSAFHLCDRMTIYSRPTDGNVNKLVVEFGEMKQLLKTQRNRRLSHHLKPTELTSLQTLLGDGTSISRESDKTFPRESGTRVELDGLNPDFLN